MAQIRTIDNQRHNVKESKADLDIMFSLHETVRIGLIQVNLQSETSRFEKGEESIKYIYEPATFIISNIMMYY